jgi:hypothetical protein
MGAQPENSAVDTLLRTITPIATAISTKKISTKKIVLRPAVLTYDIEGAFNQVYPVILRRDAPKMYAHISNQLD